MSEEEGGNVVGLDGLPATQVDEDVVKALEAALDKARSGQYVSVAVAAVMPGGYVQWSIESTDDIRLLGAVDLMAHRLRVLAMNNTVDR